MPGLTLFLCICWDWYLVDLDFLYLHLLDEVLIANWFSWLGWFVCFFILDFGLYWCDCAILMFWLVYWCCCLTCLGCFGFDFDFGCLFILGLGWCLSCFGTVALCFFVCDCLVFIAVLIVLFDSFDILWFVDWRFL